MQVHVWAGSGKGRGASEVALAGSRLAPVDGGSIATNNALRSGQSESTPEDLLFFPGGLIGWESHCHWTLAGDEGNSAVAWLQSVDHPDLTLPVVSPRLFVPGYRVRLPRAELAALGLAEPRGLYVLVVVSPGETGWCLNLKAPLLLNLNQRVGRQVIANGDWPLRFAIEPGVMLRLSA